jgi:hypothetical protein
VQCDCNARGYLDVRPPVRDVHVELGLAVRAVRGDRPQCAVVERVLKGEGGGGGGKGSVQWSGRGLV